MHDETQPDGSLIERLDVTACVKCGQRFERRLFTYSYLWCACTDGSRGHRTVHCLRPGCNGVTYDPAHVIHTGPNGDSG